MLLPLPVFLAFPSRLFRRVSLCNTSDRLAQRWISKGSSTGSMLQRQNYRSPAISRARDCSQSNNALQLMSILLHLTWPAHQLLLARVMCRFDWIQNNGGTWSVVKYQMMESGKRKMHWLSIISRRDASTLLKLKAVALPVEEQHFWFHRAPNWNQLNCTFLVFER